MDAFRVLNFTQRRFGWVALVAVMINVAIFAGVAWFVWKLVAMATGH